MNFINLLFTVTITVVCIAVSVTAYSENHIEDAKLFAIYGCMVLLIGIFNKEDNGKENREW